MCDTGCSLQKWWPLDLTLAYKRFSLSLICLLVSDSRGWDQLQHIGVLRSAGELERINVLSCRFIITELYSSREVVSSCRRVWIYSVSKAPAVWCRERQNVTSSLFERRCFCSVMSAPLPDVRSHLSLSLLSHYIPIMLTVCDRQKVKVLPYFHPSKKSNYRITLYVRDSKMN